MESKGTPLPQPVTVMSVTAKDTGWFDIELSDGNTYSTKKQALATQAQNLRGQTVLVSATTRVKGEYTNRYLESIEPASVAGNASTATSFVGQVTPTASNSPTIIPQAKSSAEKDASINRCTAAKAVATLRQGQGVSTQEYVDEFLEVAFALDHGRPQSLNDVLTDVTPQDVSAGIPGVQVGAEQQPAQTDQVWS